MERPNTPPDASNEKCDFWIDESSTKYLHTGPDGKPIKSLKNHTVLKAWLKVDGSFCYAVSDGKEFVADAPDVSRLGTVLDVLKILHSRGIK